MKIGFTITARMKSTRLPLKALRLIENKPMIDRLIERIKLTKEIDNIILCTSTNPQDEILIDYAKRASISYFRGSETDVLKRLYDAAVKHNLDYIISTTADNPLTDPFFAYKIAQEMKKTQADYYTCLDLPIGLFSYGLKVEAIKYVLEQKKENDTEIWGVYFANSDRFQHQKIKVSSKYIRPSYRFTVDTPEDFQFINEIFRRLENKGLYNSSFTIDDIFQLLNDFPELISINSMVKQKKAKKFTKIT